MIKVLLRVVGVLLAVGGVAAGWFGYATLDEVQGLEQNIYVERSQMAYGKSEARKEKGEKSIEGWQGEIEGKKTASYIWFGGAAVALVAGVSMVLLPSSRKKRKAAVAEPAPDPVAAPPSPPDAITHTPSGG
jgi:hypothetical protein